MRRLPRLVTAAALAGLVFPFVPLAAVAVFSFNKDWRLPVWTGFTTKWYGLTFEDERVMEAMRNTAVLAVASTAIATVVGTLLAIGMDRFPWPRWFRRVMDLIVHLPVVTPDIIIAAALVVAMAVLRGVGAWAAPAPAAVEGGHGGGLMARVFEWFEPGMLTMVLGHVTFQTPFVALVVRSRLATIGPRIEEAARDLYAGNWYIIRRVRLPLLWPGILAGAMLAFTLSLDDFVISFFTSSPTSVTLPIYIYGELRKGITAGTYALSTIIFAATVFLVLGTEQLARRSRRLTTDNRPPAR